MSSRQLRKLQQQKELERAQQNSQDDSDVSEDIEEPVTLATKVRPNLFAALGGEGDDNNEENNDDDDDDGGGGAPLTEAQESSTVEQPASTKKSKKKKKKNKKATAAATAQNSALAEDEQDDEDEIDKAIKELKISTQKRSTSGEQEDESSEIGPRKRMNELLSINPYNLRAVHEMRNLFGRDVIEAVDAEEQQEQQSRRRRQQMPREVDLETFLREPPGAKKLPEVSLRRNIFVQGKEHWPRQSAGGLTLKEIEKSADGLSTEYAYLHDKSYDAAQALFFACVQIGDPMRMVHFLKEAPYHVSTLLQVSSVAKQDQNMALAAELCERALFTFGRVTTSAFRQDIENGRARFDFRRPENRQFWLAGYHYLRSLIRKGTYRTALEWAKLLYALDPQDPYAMRHYIHFLALRAYESKWLIDFLDQMALVADHPDIIYLRQSLVLAKLQTGDNPGARDILENGIKTVPWLYCALFQELHLDAPPAVWGINADSDDRMFWVKLYIHQTKDLWNNTQATTFLQEVARSMDKVDISSLPSRDPVVDRGATRLAYLEGQTTLLAVAPRNLLDVQPNYEFDPLPPPKEENIFTAESTQLPWEREANVHDRQQQVIAHLRHLVDRRALLDRGDVGAARGGQGGMMMGMNNFDDDDDDDEEIRALRAADDEELQRDIEAHMNWGGNNEQGILGTLMQMLGVGRRANDEGGDEDEQDDNDDIPGAWPEEHSQP